MAAADPPTPPRRADAARNRARILEVARAAFAEPGPPLSMAEISRRAEVGMATLYRNFADRRALVEALYSDEVDAICAAATPAEGQPPGDALIAWLRGFLAFSSSKRELAAELLSGRDGDATPLHAGRARVMAAGRPLLAAAQEAGEVRADLSLEQVLEMVIALARIEGEPAYVEPILDAALDGLRR